ncbi:hypothetical protein Ccrd_025611 [Cynara cardunculus var. scolymus]|uniref:Uncharacterized protein n=1 Tax=Cynara cardunculus var. scolymus TaxID=59895 RepID=A0A103WAR2_CYNCS|nr:hypothetical protein Ccrd_025611 [Cynara cardunculus var. scolymus]
MFLFNSLYTMGKNITLINLSSLLDRRNPNSSSLSMRKTQLILRPSSSSKTLHALQRMPKKKLTKILEDRWWHIIFKIYIKIPSLFFVVVWIRIL